MADQLAPDAEFGSYYIVRPIGGGGMARIYLAKTRGLAGFEKYLALKVINPEYATEERFIRMLIDEAKITVGLSHVNIAQVFDLGHVDGIYYIAMEYVDGLDVLELVNGLHTLGERLPIEAVAYIGRQICSGLHYAHTRKDKAGKAQNIVHRDISPQNIIVSRNGEVKVVDFGIAKAAGMTTKTQAGVIKGKVNYMAPEQAMGQKADARTDLFSAGIVMWEMLTSQMVYNSNNMGELVAAVRKADIRSPASVRPEVPSGLDGIVMKALAKRVEERYQNAHQLQVELTKFLSATSPDYGGTKLAALVERVTKGEAAIDGTVSRDDLIPDGHSLIFQMEQSSGPRLLVRTPSGEKIFELTDDDTIIGRAGELAVTDVRVSRQHARIHLRGDEHLVEDLGSSNGTFVNDQRLSAARVLKDRDRICIGNVELIYVPGTPAEAAASPAAASPAPPPPAVASPAPPPPAAASPAPPPPAAAFPAPPPPASPLPSKMVVATGDRVIEHQLGQLDEVELTYVVQIGPLKLEGCCGRVVRRDGAYWLEPRGGRVQVHHQGQVATAPVRLTLGDAFEIGGTSFRIAGETRPFDAASSRGQE